MKISEIIKKGSLISLLLFLFFVPFGFTATNVFLLIFYAGVVCNRDLYNISNIKKISISEKSFVYFSIAYYLWCLTSLLWSDDLDRGLLLVGRYVSVMLLPIFFSLGKAGGIIKNVRPLCFAFIVGVFVSSFICLYLSYLDCWHEISEKRIFCFDFYMRMDISLWESISGGFSYFSYVYLSHFIHPSYYSLYFLFAIVFIICELKKLNSYGFRFLATFLLFYSIVFIYLLQSRANILASIIVALLFFVCYSVWEKKILPVLMFIVVSFVFINFGVNKSNRLYSVLLPFKEAIFESKMEKSDVRLIIWCNALQVIKQHPILGVGIGDTDTELEMQYQNNDVLFEFGTHNQYIYAQLSMGVLGVLLLLAMLFIPFYYGIKNRCFSLIGFSVAVMINLLFENMLTRNAGIMFIPWAMMVLLMMSEEKNNVLEK